MGTFAAGVVLTSAAMAVLVWNELPPKASRPWWLEPNCIFIFVVGLGLTLCALIVNLGTPQAAGSGEHVYQQHSL